MTTKAPMHITHRALSMLRTDAKNANLPPDEAISYWYGINEQPSNTTPCGLDSWQSDVDVIHVLEREYDDEATGDAVMDWILEVVTFKAGPRGPRSKRRFFTTDECDVVPTCPTCAVAWDAATAGLDWRTPERNAGQERDEREEHARLMDEVNDPRDFRRP